MRTFPLLLALTACGPAFTEGAAEPGSPDAAADVAPGRPADPNRINLEKALDSGDEDRQGVRPEPVDAAADVAVDGDAAPSVPAGCRVVACAPRDPACCTGYGFASYCGGFGGGWLCCAQSCP